MIRADVSVERLGGSDHVCRCHKAPAFDVGIRTYVFGEILFIGRGLGDRPGGFCAVGFYETIKNLQAQIVTEKGAGGADPGLLPGMRMCENIL